MMAALLRCRTHVPSEHLAEDIAWPGWLDAEDIAKTYPSPSITALTEAEYAASLEPKERHTAGNIQ